MWSQYFNCSHRTGNMVPILCLTAVFCLCPVIFYVGNRIHGEPDSNRLKIVKRKCSSKLKPLPLSPALAFNDRFAESQNTYILCTRFILYHFRFTRIFHLFNNGQSQRYGAGIQAELGDTQNHSLVADTFPTKKR